MGYKTFLQRHPERCIPCPRAVEIEHSFVLVKIDGEQKRLVVEIVRTEQEGEQVFYSFSDDGAWLEKRSQATGKIISRSSSPMHPLAGVVSPDER